METFLMNEDFEPAVWQSPNHVQWLVVMYDIQDDKLRLALSKGLERHGMQRMQKSVFWGMMHEAHAKTFKRWLAATCSDLHLEDQVVLIPMQEGMLRAMETLGKPTDEHFVFGIQKATVF